MNESKDDKSVTDQLREAAGKLDEKLEPDEQQSSTSGRGGSDPFDNPARGDEARSGDAPAGGID